MVITQYERYLFTKTENRQTVKNEIIRMNHDQLLKEAGYAAIRNKKEKLIINENPSNESIIVDTEVTKHAADPVKRKAYFIPDLISKTRVEYRNFDVDIQDVHISTPDEKL